MIKRIIKNIYIKVKFLHKLKFAFSANIGTLSSFEGMNRIFQNTMFSGEMGFGSYIGRDCIISGKIGKFTSIGAFVHINNGVHPYTEPFATTSPAFYSSKGYNGKTFTKKQIFKEFLYADKENKYPVIIGNDCWIGQGVFMAGGITIGDGAVVLSHAVVTKNIPPYAIVGGIPAKVIKYRYDEDTIRFLRDLKWWDKEIAWLKSNAELLCNIDRLKLITPPPPPHNIL